MADKLMGSLKSRNISQIITERITAGIMNGELKPGQRLPTEEEFAARIGAGKSSVREAVKILEALGVLEIRRGDGTYVVDEFTGSMLDPVVYGILLAEKNEDDVLDFKLRVQDMAAADLLEHAASAQCAQLTKLPCDSYDDLLALEEALSRKVTNPLIGELYRQAIHIAARAVEPYAEALKLWLGAYVSALARNDAAQVYALLDEERSLLGLQRG